MPTEPTSAALREETDLPGVRVRRQLRDATAVAAVSLTGSVLVVATLWAVASWLG